MDMNKVWPGWEVVRKIGSGSFGNVYEIQRDVFGMVEKAALKVISIPHSVDEIDDLRAQGHTEPEITKYYQQCLQQIVREYSIMTQIRGHANVVNCDDVQYVPHDDGIGWDIYIKMELLHPLMKSLDSVATEAQVVKLGRDISEALVCCKEHNIIHRDIKPQNIFVSDRGDFKLGDFGIAKTVERTTGGTRIGTYKYMAPEVYNNHPYGAASDVYSLGLVLYWLLNDKRTPFLPPAPQIATSAHEEQAGLRRFRGEAIPEPKYGSPELKRIVLKACAYASADRYASAAEMLADLKALDKMAVAPFPPIPTGGEVAPDSKDTVLLDDLVQNPGETVVLNQQETMLLEEEPKKKKKGALWVILGAAVVGIIILLLLLQSCDGRPDGGDQGGTTVPTTGSVTTAPTTGSVTTAPTTENVTTAPTVPPEVKQITITMDLGFVNTEADGKVSYDSYGVSLKEKTVAEGAKITLDTPTRQGYDFAGWYTAETGGQKVNADVTASENVTYYARWTGNKVKVTFDAGGGTFANGAATMVVENQNGAKYVLPKETPTKEGYNFMGWSYGSVMITADTVKNNVTEQTLLAMWGEGEYSYKIEYVAEYKNGDRKLIGEDSVIHKIDGTYTITPKTFTGYKTPAAQKVKWDVAGVKTITFVYEPEMVTGAVYYKYGANGTQELVTFEYNSNPKITAKEITGYTPNVQVQVGTAWGVNGTPAITFTYTANTYTVVFNTNGGSSASNIQVTYGGNYTNLPTVKRDGYTFGGWSTSSGASVTNSTKVTTAGNHTLVAQWTANTYTVSFNANGGTGSMSAQSFTYDTAKNLTANGFARAGYAFQGWATSSGGSVAYADKASVKNLTATANGTVTLYAVWKANTYTVSFNANGGTGSMSAQSFTYDAAKNLTANGFARTGYAFQGWATSSGGSVAYADMASVKNLTATANGTVTLYAVWKANTYTVSFNANGGTGSMSNQTYTYGQTQALSANKFTKANSVFLGWCVDAGVNRVDYSDKYVCGNWRSNQGEVVTLYAVWETLSMDTSNKQIYYEPNGLKITYTSATTFATENTGAYSKTGQFTAYPSGFSGTSLTVKATVNIGGVTYSSNNTGVVKVDSAGKITAVGVGSATITAKSDHGVTLSYVVYSSYENDGIVWTSSNTSVATVVYSSFTDPAHVGGNTTVTAVGRGTATITAKTTNGYTASCTVTVYEAYKAVALTSTSAYADFHITGDSYRGLFLCNTEADTSLTVMFNTAASAPTNGVIYQCESSSGANGCAVFIENGKIAVRQRYNSNNSYVRSTYALKANACYTVTVTVKYSPKAKCEIKIVENGASVATESGTFSTWGQDGASYASIGPKSSIFYGTAPNIYLRSITIVGTQGYYGYYKNQTYTANFANGSIGQTSFTSGNFTADFKSTSVQWYYW